MFSGCFLPPPTPYIFKALVDKLLGIQWQLALIQGRQKILQGLKEVSACDQARACKWLVFGYRVPYNKTICIHTGRVNTTCSCPGSSELVISATTQLSPLGNFATHTPLQPPTTQNAEWEQRRGMGEGENTHRKRERSQWNLQRNLQPVLQHSFLVGQKIKRERRNSLAWGIGRNSQNHPSFYFRSSKFLYWHLNINTPPMLEERRQLSISFLGQHIVNGSPSEV